MAGARIDRVITRREKLRYPFPSDFQQRLQGQRVEGVSRRAKYLLIALASNDTLLMHLGMSGSIRVMRGNRPVARRPYYNEVEQLETHDHVVLEMSNGQAVVFNDPRRFGFMTVVGPNERSTHGALAKLGPEPLARTFDVRALATALGRRKVPLKLALADQRVIAGLGNIYVVEALHRAGLSPKRRASTMVTRGGDPKGELFDLVGAIKDVLKRAIANQYRTGADDPFLVYDHEGERCPRRGCGGKIKRIVQGGRSTFYCPQCQR